ncbi:gfo/Idh/MocA family oxidoreductase [Granulicatella sp. zg-ZJ]|uniref:Gfo/Idh/MocA family protein n=1 Tax=unclassified Granulicatella TaxID=2630493 RepID=UPI0013C24903|nr:MULTISPECIES: Gfo/Idh/MocA family oxidoreductase [unclassified Granulicatella]NEW62683.1 gfo/Idh/MocA family oxidoreductase [Granulicatella sp. zg-ZJ]NEW65830.1 gfo/Idh/MocA family oxidoreductase [Granulicatella sp. zg-84]QMI86334.1 Gfo/Idh/MocA family oxidoreductase [Carnobacteriaceae bacterium zg-84]
MIKIGVIGTSAITKESMLSALSTKLYKLQVVYSRKLESAQRFGEQFGVTEYETDLECFVNREDIDLVYIASPNASHFSQVCTALKARKHVVVEKPAFVTAKQWDTALQLAKENNTYLFEAIRTAYEPNFNIVTKTIKNFEKIDGAILNFCQFSSRIEDVYHGIEHNIFSKEHAGGAIMDLGVYLLHAALSWFGEPTDIDYDAQLLWTGVDGQGVIRLTYPTFSVYGHISKQVQSYVASEIYTKEMTLSIQSIDRITDITLINKKTNEKQILSVPAHPDRMIAEWQAFFDILQGKDQEFYQERLQIGRKVTEITEQLRRQVGILFKEDDEERG